MSRENRVLRVYEEVQGLIHDFIKQGMKPTTQQLQNMLYGSNYNPDSRIQQGTIYGCIMKGRENVITLWDAYVKDNNSFMKDVARIEYYEAEIKEKELRSQDFSEFIWELEHKKFGEDTEEIVKSLVFYPATAIIFNRKMSLYSEQGNNFLISSGGNKASWYIPSWWIWNIREYNLYRRTLKILRTQLQRGIDTKVLLPSREPLEKMLTTQETLRLMVEGKK